MRKILTLIAICYLKAIFRREDCAFSKLIIAFHYPFVPTFALLLLRLMFFIVEQFPPLASKWMLVPDA